MALPSLKDLIPNLTDADMLPDTDSPVIDVDPKTNPTASEARTVTLSQIHELFNVMLRRSNVRKRLGTEEGKTRLLEQKVEALEQWRQDIEERIAVKNEQIDQRFLKNEELHSNLEAYTKFSFSGCEKQKEINDGRNKEMRQGFKAAHIDRNRIDGRCTTLDAQMKEQRDKLDEKIDTNYRTLWAFTEDVQAHVDATL